MLLKKKVVNLQRLVLYSKIYYVYNNNNCDKPLHFKLPSEPYNLMVS